jgi:hypothetical protein
MPETPDNSTLTLVKLTPSPRMQPPRVLGRYGLALWNSIHAGYEIGDAGGIELLLQACEMQDRVQSMAVQITADGPVIRTKTGIRSHPLLKDETAGRGFIVRTLAKLGVVYAEIQAPGRPGSNPYWTGA